jgi:uncharacterized protein
VSQIATVQEIYAAFGRGDVPAILDRLAEDVAWETTGTSVHEDVPWLLPRVGRWPPTAAGGRAPWPRRA